MDRRELLKSALAGTVALSFPSLLRGQGGSSVRRLSDKLAVIDGGGTNVVVFGATDGLVLVDSGAPNNGDRIVAALKTFVPNAKVTTLFNTHHHFDQTGNNEMFSAAGAKIIAHKRTLEWMSSDHWVTAEDRYEKARPKAARPSETFLTTGSLKTGGEQIDYGYLTMAHTNGDIYVFFRNSNVLAVGDVASPLRDPALDYFTGAWIGGRVDAMDILLKLANEANANRARVRARYVESGIQGGAGHDGRGSGPPVQTGSGRRRPQGHAGGRRSERPRANMERSVQVPV